MQVGDKRQRPYVLKRAMTGVMKAADKKHRAEGGETPGSEMERQEERTRIESQRRDGASHSCTCE